MGGLEAKKLPLREWLDVGDPKEDKNPGLPGVVEKLAEVGVLKPLPLLPSYPRYCAGGVSGGSVPRLFLLASLAIRSGGGLRLASVTTL